ncbi:MAG: hypothetical protein HKN39_00090 [Flavobacteriales bacterium]|nr:hypothetical protein [Flavobacteriales bacterium]
MHTIEPYYNWRNYYTCEADERSPFFEKVYSEFEFSDKIYNFYIHPQWDNIGSPTLFIKIIYADYDQGFTVIELIGEWNDAINNDIMFLKRNIIEELMHEGLNKFILIGENVLNFHGSDDCYYEEWFDEVMDQDGWIALMNFRDHVLTEFQEVNIDNYLLQGGELLEMEWRTFTPQSLFRKIDSYAQKRLGLPS